MVLEFSSSTKINREILQHSVLAFHCVDVGTARPLLQDGVDSVVEHEDEDGDDGCEREPGCGHPPNSARYTAAQYPGQHLFFFFSKM